MIRRARAGDAATISAIWNPIIRDSSITFTTAEKTEAEIEALIASHPVWIADGGFATYAPFRSGPGYARTQEHSIHLSPAARGSGLGRALMQALCEHAAGAGHKSLIAGIGGENTQAIGFHTHLGFTEVGRIPKAGWKFDRWHDLVLMQRFL